MVFGRRDVDARNTSVNHGPELGPAQDAIVALQRRRGRLYSHMQYDRLPTDDQYQTLGDISDFPPTGLPLQTIKL